MIATCTMFARLVRLDNTGRVRRHDTVDAVIRARTGKRRKRCAGSGRWPRRVER